MIKDRLNYLSTQIVDKTKQSLFWNPSKTQKILLCRPKAGFNDILVQIYKCKKYAIRFNRKLYVDTSRSYVHTCFSNYFISTDQLEFGTPPNLEQYNESVYPTFLRGKVHTYNGFLIKKPDDFVKLNQNYG